MDIRLIYASQSTRAMSENDLETLLTQARGNNTIKGFSGLLLYCSQSFLQALEGESDEIDRVYQKISADPRHKNLRLLSRHAIERRKFSQWSMGFSHVDQAGLAAAFPGYKPATKYPLISADLVRNGAIAETFLDVYQRNA